VRLYGSQWTIAQFDGSGRRGEKRGIRRSHRREINNFGGNLPMAVLEANHVAGRPKPAELMEGAIIADISYYISMTRIGKSSLEEHAAFLVETEN
jgi:hypothetical protein